MSSAKHDYQQFLAWLHRPEHGASEDARRIANLVDVNFDRVAASARAQSRRSIVLAATAREALSDASFELPGIASPVQASIRGWKAYIA